MNENDDKIKFISYNRPLSFQHVRTAREQTRQNEATEIPPLPLLQAHKSISVKLTVSGDLQIKQSEGFPNKCFTL